MHRHKSGTLYMTVKRRVNMIIKFITDHRCIPQPGDIVDDYPVGYWLRSMCISLPNMGSDVLTRFRWIQHEYNLRIND